MYPRRLLIVTGVLVFLASLLVLMPARVAFRALPAGLPVSGVEGSLLDGHAQVATGIGPLDVSWHLQPWRLLALGAGGRWTVSATGLVAEGALVMHPWGASLDITRGEVGAARLSRLLPSGTRVDQPLLLRDVAVRGSRTAFGHARGRLAWGPGTVTWQGGEARQLPALRGELAAVGGRLELTVDGEADPGQPLARVTYDPSTGEYHAAVLQRAATLLGRDPKPGEGPDSPLVEVRQRLR